MERSKTKKKERNEMKKKRNDKFTFQSTEGNFSSPDWFGLVCAF